MLRIAKQSVHLLDGTVVAAEVLARLQIGNSEPMSLNDHVDAADEAAVSAARAVRAVSAVSRDI